MTKAIARDPIYRRRRFQPELIELCVRWYLTYRLSHGLDPSALKAALGKHTFAATMRAWEIARGHQT